MILHKKVVRLQITKYGSLHITRGSSRQVGYLFIKIRVKGSTNFKSGHCGVVRIRIPPRSMPKGFPCHANGVIDKDSEPVNFFESKPILRTPPNVKKDFPVCNPAADA